jgi:hypothetical protein
MTDLDMSTATVDKEAITIGSLRRLLVNRRACWAQEIQPTPGITDDWVLLKPGALAMLDELIEELGDDERGPSGHLDGVDESSALIAANIEIARLHAELERNNPVRILSPVTPTSQSRVAAERAKPVDRGNGWIEIDLGNGVRKRVRTGTVDTSAADTEPSAPVEPVEPAKDRKNTVVRAYMLRDRTGYVESTELVFARTAREARKSGYLDNVEYINLEVTRAPEFDKFADMPGRPTLRDKLEHGWWQVCGGCGLHVKIAGDETDAAKVITEDDAFCNDVCQARHEGTQRGMDFANAERSERCSKGRTKPAHNLANLRSIADALREARRATDWQPSSDLLMLDQMQAIYETLSESDRAIADAEGWRSWPDERYRPWVDGETCGMCGKAGDPKRFDGGLIACCRSVRWVCSMACLDEEQLSRHPVGDDVHATSPKAFA